MNQIIFLKDGKLVCYLYGYPENNGFRLILSKSESESIVLDNQDDINLLVEKRIMLFFLTFGRLMVAGAYNLCFKRRI